MLADFGGKQSRVCRTSCVLQEERTDGDRLLSVEAEAIGDTIEVRDAIGSRRTRSCLHSENCILGKAKIRRGGDDTEERGSRGLRCCRQAGPAKCNRVGVGGGDGSADSGGEGRDNVNRNDLAEMNGTCIRLAGEILESTRELRLHLKPFGVNKEGIDRTREVYGQAVAEVERTDQGICG